MKNIKLLSVMSELGAGTRGASLGYAAMLTASHKFNSDFFKQYPAEEIANENHRLFDPVTTPNAKHIDGIVVMYKRIADKLKEVCANGDMPLVLGAAHSTAGGTIAGMKAAYPDKTLGVIWVDAHADLHSPYTTPSGNVHGMPLATALKDDNRECQINTPDAHTIAQWNMLSGEEARVAPEHLIFFGVRDTELPEDAMIERLGIKNYTVDEVRMRGVKPCVMEAIDKLAACDIIYVSFDVDSMDSAISNGTGTPVINGFSAVEAEKILSYLVQNEKLACLEFVEVNPTLDEKGNVMAETAFDILERVTGIMAAE